MEWVIGLLGVLVGGGGVFTYLSARGQLDLDRTKHQDELDAPKRLHRLNELQAAARALSAAMEATRVMDGIDVADDIHMNQIKALVAASLPAVESLAPEAVESYRTAEAKFDDYAGMRSDRKDTVRLLQAASREIHDAIQTL